MVVMVMVVCRAEPYANSRMMMMMVMVVMMTHLHRDLREFCAGILSPSLYGFVVRHWE